jgi:hypothetical protein
MAGSTHRLIGSIGSPQDEQCQHDEQHEQSGQQEHETPTPNYHRDYEKGKERKKRTYRQVATLHLLLIAYALATLKERIAWRRGGLPMRYGGLITGSGLLMFASVASIPLGPWTNAPLRELLAVMSGAAGLACLMGSCLVVPVRAAWRRWYQRLRPLTLALALLLSVGTVVTFAGGVELITILPAPRTYFTDILAFSHMDAQLLLAGQNPYTASATSFQHALARFSDASATPVRGPVFGKGYTQPDPAYVYTVQRQYVQTQGHGHMQGAFDPQTLHSYPALSFLLYAPLLRVGIHNILLLHIIVYWCLFAWLVWLAPVGWRHWGALAALAAMPTLAASLLVSDEVIVIALILVAWHWREQRYLSSFLLGMACAYKQYAWFFLPFFALDILLSYGMRETFWRGLLTFSSFLLPNLPFLIANPHAWVQSMLLPMNGSFFANGMGIIALSIGQIVPYAPPLLYASLEVLALLAALVAMARWRSRLGDGVLVLALLPLFFAFRSLPDYFAFTPWLALYAVNRLYARRSICAAKGDSTTIAPATQES